MKDLFPYVGEPVTVTKDMCDFNGHMNVNYIKKVLNRGGISLTQTLVLMRIILTRVFLVSL